MTAYRTRTQPSRFWWMPAAIVAVVLRVIVLASNGVSFHSDEAIVGLMARHINQGQPIPTFFYGQPYMGSLDPLLVAGMFRLFGESVLSIRLGQSLLYLGIVLTTMTLALQLSKDRRLAGMAGLLVAVPPVVMTLYTTVSLGGYGETLLLGNLLLLVGYRLCTEADSPWWHWFALGAITGLGWWTNNLIVAYVLPVGIFLLVGVIRESARRSAFLRMLPVILAAFLIFSIPWWLYNARHEWQSVQFLTSGFQSSSGVIRIGVGDKLLGLILLGLPAVMGIRFPWTIGIWPGAWAVGIVIPYLVLLALSAVYTVRRAGEERFLWTMVAGFAGLFVLSGFGVDATGRYLLPLVVPLAILLAAQIQRLAMRTHWALALILILIGANLLGTLVALGTIPPGLTPQFDAATDIPNDDDQAVIDFLLAHGGQYGYTTYWAAYRLAFLSGEKVLLSPQLPYKTSLIYAETDRYPLYTTAVAQVERPVLVTANLPQLDQIIMQRLQEHNIIYQRQVIGPFTIFYDLSRRITPQELGLQTLGFTAQ